MMRLIDVNALLALVRRRLNNPTIIGWICRLISEVPTIEAEPVRHGRWVWKHRHHGGFRKYTGVDEFGETHTITVDERSECDEPYCPYCGKWNESVFRNYCPNCGAKMDKENDNG